MNARPSVDHRFSPLDYFKIGVLGFALSAVSNAMHAIILPIRIRDFFGPLQQSTYLGLITFAGLIIAILIQPVAGAISDRSGFRWGRRKPFILIGIVAGTLFLLGIGSVAIYLEVFILWCLAQASLNVAHGPFQAFIPDLAPPDKRGLASGVKNSTRYSWHSCFGAPYRNLYGTLLFGCREYLALAISRNSWLSIAGGYADLRADSQRKTRPQNFSTF